jgi:AcrR family transcriptional regulator
MTDKEVLIKALDLFNEKGYAHVGMRELARALDISPGNLTYYFKKKEDVLAALLDQFASRNSQTIESYLQQEPSNANFLRLMRSIFENQFMYRGVYVGNQFFPVVVEKKIFDYQSVVTKRKAVYKEILTSLGNTGHLQVDEKDISFLLSFITFFGRFWITEATLFDKSPNRDEVVEHYLFLFARQLSLFSTDVGKESIKMYGIKF